MGSSLSMHDDALALGLRMLERAQAAGARISFDPNLRPQLDVDPERAPPAFAPFTGRRRCRATLTVCADVAWFTS
jgi:sugar/nucleoside kinase (ribokinase family)